MPMTWSLPLLLLVLSTPSPACSGSFPLPPFQGLAHTAALPRLPCASSVPQVFVLFKGLWHTRQRAWHVVHWSALWQLASQGRVCGLGPASAPRPAQCLTEKTKITAGNSPCLWLKVQQQGKELNLKSLRSRDQELPPALRPGKECWQQNLGEVFQSPLEHSLSKSVSIQNTGWGHTHSCCYFRSVGYLEDRC